MSDRLDPTAASSRGAEGRRGIFVAPLQFEHLP